MPPSVHVDLVSIGQQQATLANGVQVSSEDEDQEPSEGQEHFV